MADFFVSFNKADRGWATWIAWELEEAGCSVVFQDWDFRPGSNFVLEMQKGASVARRTIAVLSPDYLTAQFTQPEWAAAFGQDPTGEKGLLVPVRVRECDLRGLMPQIVYIDLVGLDEEAAREKLLAGISEGRRKPTAAPAFPGKIQPTGQHTLTEHPAFPGPSAPAAAGASAKAVAPTSRSGTDTDRQVLEQASERITAAVAKRSDLGSACAILQIVWVTPGEEEVIDPVQFGQPRFKQQLQRVAHEGESPLFDFSHPKEERAHASRLSVIQTGGDFRQGQNLVAVDVHEDGTLSVSLNVTGLYVRDPLGIDLATMHQIDPDDLRQRLEQACSFAGRWWELIDPDAGHDALLYNLVLHHVGRRRLERRAATPVTSVTVPEECPHDPLFVYERPRRVNRSVLGSPTEEIQRAQQMLALRFDEWKSPWERSRR
jgi:hypothetical protein